jgi:uncharacterized protein YggE
MAVSLAGVAQEDPYSAVVVEDYEEPTVQSVGVATDAAVPDYVEFWFHYEGTGETLQETVAAARAFAEAFPTAVEERGLTPLEMRVSRVAVPDANRANAYVTARLRLALGGADAQATDTAFAAACEAARGLAAQHGAVLEGPSLGVSDPAPFERSAIGRAVENAYPHAEAVTDVLGARIIAVQSVEVLDVRWNRDPEAKGAQPDVGRVTCTARVRLTYTYSAQ